MSTQLMVKPSSLLTSGIQMQQAGNLSLFRFTEELQSRFEFLLSIRKSRSLTTEEEAELAGIAELSRIFTFINAQLSVRAQWCPLSLFGMWGRR